MLCKNVAEETEREEESNIQPNPSKNIEFLKCFLIMESTICLYLNVNDDDDDDIMSLKNVSYKV